MYVNICIRIFCECVSLVNIRPNFFHFFFVENVVDFKIYFNLIKNNIYIYHFDFVFVLFL